LRETLADFFAAGACPDFAATNFTDFFCLGFAATLPQAVKVLFLAAGFGFFAGLRMIFGMIMYT
jgi:hypothetical protein